VAQIWCVRQTNGGEEVSLLECLRKSESRRRASIDLPDIKLRGLQPTLSGLPAPFTVLGSSDCSTIHQVQRSGRARCRVDTRT